MKTKLLFKTFLILTIFSVSSCRDSIKFDPDAYFFKRESDNSSGKESTFIFNEKNHKVPIESREIFQYACMHKNKWLELSELTQTANQKTVKRKIDSVIKKLR